MIAVRFHCDRDRLRPSQPDDDLAERLHYLFRSTNSLECRAELLFNYAHNPSSSSSSSRASQLEAEDATITEAIAPTDAARSRCARRPKYSSA